MGYSDPLNIMGSALTAEWSHMNIVMRNLVNQNTIRVVEGGPYKRKQVVSRENMLNFRGELGRAMTKTENDGVSIGEAMENQDLSVPVYDSDHPDADEDRYMIMPNVSSTEEVVGLTAASHAYGASVMTLNVVKSMALKALKIGK